MEDKQTAETVRTAAYLAARERLDARKTARNVQCNPPNVRCGSRCIPPTWDCRLKGQGTDPHLRAVKTDPLGGLANIQRGFGRISKGVVKGNFSEVEGGKRAIIRGTVKIAPGNIQQKKELQKKLEDRTRAIGIGLAVVTGGLGIHALLMKSNIFGYRNGVGANINNATRAGVSRVLDATPIIGANRARVRAAVQSGVQEQLIRQANPVSAVLTGQLSRTRLTGADIDARTNLVQALERVNAAHGGPNSDFNSWNREHQRAFWSTTRVENGVGLSGDKRGSVFARPATDDFMARQFNLQGDDVLTSRAIKDAVERRLTEYKSSLLDLAQQQGYQVKNTRGGGRALDPKDQRTFIQSLVSNTLPAGQSSDRVRSELTKSLEDSLSRTPKGQADELYRRTFGTFNEFYTSRATAIESVAASSRLTAEMRRTGVEQTWIDARQARAQYVLGLIRPGSEVRGPAHADLALREYHARQVSSGRSLYTISDNQAVAAASEIAGRPVRRAEAFQILEREGLTGAVPRDRRAQSRQRPMTEGEAVYQLMRQNPGMTLQAARREIKNRRGDASPELARTATYLALRADLKENPRLGKPCGASHIPKAHECRKGQRAEQSETQRSSHLGRKIAIAAVVAAVGAVGVTVALDAHRFYTSKDLPNPPGYREAVRAAQGGDPKVGYDVAIGRHYDKVVSDQGWKPGELVYTRYGSGSSKNDPTGHFAVYIGKQGDRHQFADFGIRDSKLREGEINLYEYGPGVKGVAPFVFVKAPRLKHEIEAFSPEQIQQRVYASLGARLKYDALDNNCETWARMITTGQARSAQVERLSAVTRSLYRYYDRKTAGSPPKDIPSVQQQARILDMQARAASGDKSARADLRAFQALIKQGKRTDGMQQDSEGELPTPEKLLAGVTSDIEAIIRTKLYLMLLVSQGQARIYGPN